jgi:hypothetical protein
MTSIGRFEIRIHYTPSIICDFHCPVDFRLDILFPHIFWFLHQNRVGIGGFTLTKLRSVGDKEKNIPSCLDTSILMIAPPVLQQSAFCALKKTDWPNISKMGITVFNYIWSMYLYVAVCKPHLADEVRSFQVFGFRHFKCSESEC